MELKSGAMAYELQMRNEMPAEIRKLFCPLTVKSIAGFRIGVMSRCDLPDNNEKKVNCARQLLQQLKAIGVVEKVRAENFAELQQGFSVLGRYVGEHQVSHVRAVVDKLFSEPLLIGPVHGDFHQDNIVVAKDGRPLLIDADCFRSRGIQLFDVIYYCFEAAQREFTPIRGWLEELSNALQGKSRFPYWLKQVNLSELLLPATLGLYFVTRLSQEHRYVERLNSKECQWVDRIVTRIVSL